jgi:hypothetical protein
MSVKADIRRLKIELGLYRATEKLDVKRGYHEVVRALLRETLTVPDEVQNVDAYVEAYARTWARTTEARAFLE